MRLLLDTHVILWALGNSPKLPQGARALIEDAANDLLFSPISIAEIAIKYALERPEFTTPPGQIVKTLRANGYTELLLTAEHAAALADLPPIHKDPFDRLLLAQARVAGVLLLTADRVMARYAGLVRAV